jgi:hypothetical protein
MIKYKIGPYLRHRVKSSDRMSALVKPIQELQNLAEAFSEQLNMIYSGLDFQHPLEGITVTHEWNEGVGMINIDVDGGFGQIFYSIDGGETFYITDAFEVSVPGDYNVAVRDGLGRQEAVMYTLPPEP